MSLRRAVSTSSRACNSSLSTSRLIKSLADLAAKDNDAQLRELLASQGISFSANPQTGTGTVIDMERTEAR
jgi:hypothetical protein